MNVRGGIGVTADAGDAACMLRAVGLARRGWGQTAPNPMVGAVVVQGGQVVGEGWHARYGAAHAEVAALAAAGEQSRGATVYVTLEPCAHQGKTPPCVDALVRAGVRRVVVGARDPSPEAAGGMERLRSAGVECVSGVEERAVRDLDPAFFHAFASDRPWVTLKLALSIDGAIADATRAPGWLTGPEARAEVHRLRAGSDAVAVGIGTALADDPTLTVRDAPPPRVAPRRVVFDRAARLPMESALVRTARETPTLVVVARGDARRVAALRDAGVEVVQVDGLAGGLRALRERGVRSLLVEGGAGLAGSLISGAFVDRMILFQAPIILGAGALPAFGTALGGPARGAVRWRVLECAPYGDDLMTVYALRDP